MNFIVLTKSGGLLGPLATLMGYIMEGIFKVVSSMGIMNVGLCIVIFTVVTKILLLPMSIKQAKSQKLMSAVQPELKLIQQKYKGKNDQQSLMMMNAETKAVYEKYGVSMGGSMVQLLIQMPILFALYRVIMNIPAYVPSVKQFFNAIVDAIGGAGAIAKVNEFAHSSEALTKLITTARISGDTISTTDHIVDFLNKLNISQWELFKNYFSEASAAITANLEPIMHMNNFLGYDLASAPLSYGMKDLRFWIIPLLAGGSQYLSARLTMKANPATDANDSAAGMMNTMNLVMPVMSVVFCISFASGIGIYWVASSVLMGIQQIFMNKYTSKMDVNEMIRQNLEKTNEKRKKKGLPPINEKASEDKIRRMQKKLEAEELKKQEKAAASREKIAGADSYYKSGSIADRARMVSQYNEKHS